MVISPHQVILECEDNIPEVENEVVKNNVRKTVDIGKVNSIKVMFEKLEKEETLQDLEDSQQQKEDNQVIWEAKKTTLVTK